MEGKLFDFLVPLFLQLFEFSSSVFAVVVAVVVLTNGMLDEATC